MVKIPADILIFGLQFPEPNSTAAGVRMLQLINLFKDFGYKVHFACAQVKTHFSIDLTQIEVIEHFINLNDSTAKKLLQDLQPKLVMFDRFITEEQFGWVVDEICPNTLKILDTEDLHFLRENRQEILKKSTFETNEYSLSEKAKREIGAIYRCDLTLMISKAEINVLITRFNLPKSLLLYLPFVFNTNEIANNNVLNYHERQNFVSIGNFRHAPNLDMVKHLHKNIWPLIRKSLPKAEWHIYGAYIPNQIEEIHKPEHGVIVKGRAEEAIDTLKQYKVMLAPLRFGAGQKGKCFDSIQAGTPSITTSIGAEGIAKKNAWPGFVKDDINEFSEFAIKLYNDKTLWKDKQEKGFAIIKIHFDLNIFKLDFKSKIEYALDHLQGIRNENSIGEILKHHFHRSTKYMSKWIEEKSRK